MRNKELYDQIITLNERVTKIDKVLNIQIAHMDESLKHIKNTLHSHDERLRNIKKVLFYVLGAACAGGATLANNEVLAYFF